MTFTWINESEYEGIGGGGTICRDSEKNSTGEAIPVFRVSELPQLVQALGYIKYRSDGPTYVRGQSQLYGGRMAPSLYRSQKQIHPSPLTSLLNTFINSLYDWECNHDHHTAANCPEQIPRNRSWNRDGSSLLVSGMRRYAVEPLLQHYGILTGWIDVVDNIWIALWFACHRFEKNGRYTHIVKRTPNENDHVYLITTTLIDSQSQDGGSTTRYRTIAPGLEKFASGARAIDLRQAVPSIYLRPHSQHGLLIRPSFEGESVQLGAFQIPLNKALDWLGQSLLLSPFGLFPPPTVDEGYRKMIEGAQSLEIPDGIGDIELVGPGY